MGNVYNGAVREKILAGADKLANAVRVTLGPMGRNVALYQKANLRGADYSDAHSADAHVLITNDGVTIAKSIVLADPAENMGAMLLKEAAIKTNEAAGDGTTTSIVLAQSVLREAFRNISAGAEPMALRRGVQKALALAATDLAAATVSIETEDDISRVAVISCQEEELGRMIGHALYTVGLEGVITVEDSLTAETTLDIQQGIVFDQGFQHPLMTTDKDQMVAELHDPYILICDAKISDPQHLLPFLIMAAEDVRSCLIISDGVEGDAMGLVLKNKIEGDMDIVCVQAPLYGEGRRWRMEDMAVQTGGVLVSKEHGMDIRRIDRTMVGTAKHVRVTRKQTIIRDAEGDPEAVENRIQELRHTIKTTDYEFNRERYRERLAKFVSGVAQISVGGATEPEMWERKMRAEDAVNAARAACEEGVVPGGGIALLSLAPKLEAYAASLEGDERTGVRIVAEAVKAPVKQILANAGLDGATFTVRLLAEKSGTGYDVQSERMMDMLANGVMDPLKVTRLALENALSVAATLLTTEAAVECRKEAGERGSL